jgi:hypothetical protein
MEKNNKEKEKKRKATKKTKKRKKNNNKRQSKKQNNKQNKNKKNKENKKQHATVWLGHCVPCDLYCIPLSAHPYVRACVADQSDTRCTTQPPATPGSSSSATTGCSLAPLRRSMSWAPSSWRARWG